MPYLVRERLFIGNIGDAAEVLQGGGDGVTHLLSLLSSVSVSFFLEWRPGLVIPAKEVKKGYFGGAEIEAAAAEEGEGKEEEEEGLKGKKLMYSVQAAGTDLKVTRMAVPLRDMEDEDLLDYLDVCLDFIDKGRREGSILVHCFAGVSRSAAIITAYLMKTERRSQEDALESLQESCEFVCPNDGFIEQLKMFEEMGFKVDCSSSIYKRFRNSYNRGEKMDSSIFAADPGLPAESISSEITPKDDVHTPCYRCKKCRRVVALQENIITHTPVEEGGMEGKLTCIHCKWNLGYFNWSGIQCSCGSWITPAFQIHKSRVDISTL
ncbi:Dual specificity protein phosphatase [Acorus calamus]|uniref:protein-tyrosine-phosphatase n=1 Tax=Acorus calamus TaxID=4465 RepID=A0AAV9CTW4_ACOCL|nr:Dual specificity protein phosphatase [Acorus calamus]